MLSDGELKAELHKPGSKGHVLRVGPFPFEGTVDWKNLSPANAEWDSKSSPIQPASIDLHVGHIYVPGRKPNTLGSEGRGETSFTLEPGHSVIVSTYEKLELPSYLAGIVFPPSELSSNGILVANIGHIDPGYEGPLRFTIINMGANGFPLERGKVAVGTIMFFKLSSDCNISWTARRTGKSLRGEPNQKEIDALAKDFADFEHRVDELTTAKLREKFRDLSLWAILAPIIISAILTYATIVATIGAGVPGRVDRNTDDILTVEKTIDNANTGEARAIRNIERRLKIIEDRLSKPETDGKSDTAPSRPALPQ